MGVGSVLPASLDDEDIADQRGDSAEGGGEDDNPLAGMLDTGQQMRQKRHRRQKQQLQKAANKMKKNGGGGSGKRPLASDGDDDWIGAWKKRRGFNANFIKQNLKKN